jgi:hypothetical protein
MGFDLKAHALMAWWDFATPDYLKTMTFDDLNQEGDEHITALVSRYQRQIDIWNVINEAHSRGAALDLTRTEIAALSQTGTQAIRAHDPDARIIVNDSFDWYAESNILIPFFQGTADGFSLPVPVYLDELAASAVDYDIIGQQLYNGGYVDIFARWGLGDPSGGAHLGSGPHFGTARPAGGLWQAGTHHRAIGALDLGSGLDVVRRGLVAPALG